MGVVWIGLVGVLLIIAVFVGWRSTSVARGGRQRDKRLLEQLDPLVQKLNSSEPVTVSEIFQPARQVEARYVLFSLLRKKGRNDLIPPNFSYKVDQAQSALAYWLMHPNEMGDPPEKIEHLQEVSRVFKGKPAQFHLFRFTMPQEHEASGDGWLLGIVGPMNPEAEPYAEPPSAFHRFGDKEGSVSLDELTDWYVEMLEKRS